MQQFIIEVLNMLALACSVYACGGAICRLRHSAAGMSRVWIFLYWYIFALSAWSVAAIMTAPLDALNCLTSIGVGIYIWATAHSWKNGIPPIAQRDA